MNLNLAGKNALVCGSSKGIGKACAHELAGLGANVTLMARSADLLIGVRDELQTVVKGQKHDFLIADSSGTAGLQSRIKSVLANKHFDILVNNTGGPPSGALLSATADDFLKAYTQHLIVNHILAGLLVPGMKKSGYGRIINIISTSVKIPLKGLGVSNTTRGAVASWAKTLSNELAPFGITVNNILPGATATDRLDEIISTKASKMLSDKDTIAAEMKAEIPMGRFGLPSEIAAAVAFLASPAASYVTGVSIPVDGGRTGSL